MIFLNESIQQKQNGNQNLTRELVDFDLINGSSTASTGWLSSSILKVEESPLYFEVESVT